MDKNRRIILILPPSNCVIDDRLEPPLGLMYIAAVLHEKGHSNVSLFDMSGCQTEKEIAVKIEEIPIADLYGLTVFCSNHPFAKRAVAQIKRLNSEAFIVAGGANASAMPEFTLKDLGVNAVVVGEGEDAFVEIASRVGSDNPLTGIVVGDGRAAINSYPFPARELVDLFDYSKRLKGELSVSMITSRGCVNHCLHCNSNIMGGGNKLPRYRSSGNVIDEIKLLAQEGFRTFRFGDDNFTSNPNLHELLEKISECDIQYRIFGRIDDLDKKTCRLLKSSGCIHVVVGLESLNPNNLKAIGKGNQIGHEKNIINAKEAGLIIRASCMVGLPDDTYANVEYYFTQAAKLPFDEFEVHPLIPFPGTRLAKNPQKWGYEIINRDFASYLLIGKERRTTFALKHQNFSPEDVMNWRKMAGDILRGKNKCYMKDSEIAR